MKKLNTVLVPSWGFLYINAHKKSIGGKCYEFSSPHGDFFILTIYIECFAKTFKTFSSPHGDFFILTIVSQFNYKKLHKVLVPSWGFLYINKKVQSFKKRR